MKRKSSRAHQSHSSSPRSAKQVTVQWLCNEAKKKNSKTTSRLQSTVEYIAGKSFLFISLNEKLDLTLFSVRRSQYINKNQSNSKSLIFNGRL